MWDHFALYFLACNVSLKSLSRVHVDYHHHCDHHPFTGKDGFLSQRLLRVPNPRTIEIASRRKTDASQRHSERRNVRMYDGNEKYRHCFNSSLGIFFLQSIFFFRFPIYRADGESLTGEARREGTKCLEAPRLAAVLTSSCQRPSNKLNETTSLEAESG